jgi:hypothetical protein
MPPGVPIAPSADAARIHADRTGGLNRADRNEQATLAMATRIARLPRLQIRAGIMGAAATLPSSDDPSAPRRRAPWPETS